MGGIIHVSYAEFRALSVDSGFEHIKTIYLETRWYLCRSRVLTQKRGQIWDGPTSKNVLLGSKYMSTNFHASTPKWSILVNCDISNWTIMCMPEFKAPKSVRRAKVPPPHQKVQFWQLIAMGPRPMFEDPKNLSAFSCYILCGPNISPNTSQTNLNIFNVLWFSNAEI